MVKRTFTLIEVIVVAAILVILAGILVSALLQLQATFQTVDISTQLDTEARLAIRRISLDLRSANLTGPVSLITSPYISSNITYELADDFDNSTSQAEWNATAIRIRLDPNNDGHLIKEYGGTAQIIAFHVQNITFSRDSQYSNYLKVFMNLEDTGTRGKVYSINSTSFINMRNYEIP